MTLRTILAVGLLLAAGSVSIAGDHGEFASHEGETLYLQHNLYHDGDDAQWMNYHDEQFLAVGTPVLIKKVDDEEIVFRVEGSKGKFTLEMDEPEPSYTAMTDRIFGSEAPSMDGLSKEDMAGIEAAEIRVGMSRRAVFMARGHPPYFHQKPFTDTKITNEDLQADTLTFAPGSWDTMIVEFENDIVVEIDD